MFKFYSMPSRAVMPIALIVLSIFGDARSSEFFVAYTLAKIMSLCAAGNVVITAGEVVSDRRLRGNFTVAALFGVIGASAAYFVAVKALKFAPSVALTAALFSVSEVFSSMMRTQRDKFSAPLSDALMAALTVAGFLVSKNDSHLMPIGAGIGLLSVIAVFGFKFAKPSFSIIKNIPIALLRYGAVSALIALFAYSRNSCAPFIIAAVYALVESPYRRLADEGRLARLLISAVFSLTGAMYFFNILPDILAELIFPMSVFCALGMTLSVETTVPSVISSSLMLTCAAITEYPAAVLTDAAFVLIIAMTDIPMTLRVIRARRNMRRRKAI